MPDGSCHHITEAASPEIKPIYINSKNHTEGVILTYDSSSSNSQCFLNQDEKMSMKLYFVCDDKVTNPIFSIKPHSLIYPCEIEVEIRSKEGCPQLLKNGMFVFLSSYPLISGGFTFSFGFLMLFFGLPWYKLTLMISGLVGCICTFFMTAYFGLLN